MPGKRVQCDRCGWRTTRVYMECECDGEYGCRCGPRVGFGRCKDHPLTQMRTSSDIRDERVSEALAAEFWRTHAL